MGNPEFLRGCGVGRQSAAGSAAVPNWLHYQTKFEITDEVKYDIPHFLNYRLWLESQATATTRVGMSEFEMRLDPWEVGWFLVSMCGAPASGVFLGGAAAAPLLTFVKVNNLSTYRQMTDAVVSDMDFDMDAGSGIWTVKGKAMGLVSEPQASPPTPSYSSTAPILAPWQTYVTRGGSAWPVITAHIGLRKLVDPVFETPGSQAAAGAPAGVTPAEFEINGATGEYAILRRYLAYAASDYYNFKHDTPNAYQLSVIDPNTSGTPGIVFNLPIAKATEGKEPDDKARERQSLKGTLLYDATTGSGFKATVSGTGAPTYAAT